MALSIIFLTFFCCLNFVYASYGDGSGDGPAKQTCPTGYYCPSGGECVCRCPRSDRCTPRQNCTGLDEPDLCNKQPGGNCYIIRIGCVPLFSNGSLIINGSSSVSGSSSTNGNSSVNGNSSTNGSSSANGTFLRTSFSIIGVLLTSMGAITVFKNWIWLTLSTSIGTLMTVVLHIMGLVTVPLKKLCFLQIYGPKRKSTVYYATIVIILLEL